MSDSKKYIVVMPGCLAYKVGEQVALTDQKAKSLVGKVRPIADHEKEIEASKAVTDMRKDLDDAGTRNKELEKEIKRMAAQVQQLTKELDQFKAGKGK